jgi:hypothetical protein
MGQYIFAAPSHSLFQASINRKMIIMAVECTRLVNSLSRKQYYCELIFSISQKYSRMFLVYVKTKKLVLF